MQDGRVQASMIVDDLTRTVTSTAEMGSDTSLGTIEIRYYVQQIQNQESHIQTVPTFEDLAPYMSSYASLTAPLLQPAQEIRLIRCNNRQTRHKWDPKDHERAGSQPWATFRFFYRTKGV